VCLCCDLMNSVAGGRLASRTRVPQAAYFREAVEDLLEKFEEPTKKAGK